MLKDYFIKPNMNFHSLVKSSFSNLIARNSKGWAVPVSIHFKTDVIGVEDCGLVGYIEKIHSSSSFLMIYETDMKIEIMSKPIYQKIFQNYCNLSDLQRIYLIRVIPLLQYLVQQSAMFKKGLTENYNFFETVAILPKINIKKSKQAYFFYE